MCFQRRVRLEEQRTCLGSADNSNKCTKHIDGIHVEVLEKLEELMSHSLHSWNIATDGRMRYPKIVLGL
jgi:hypothetical protein